MAGTNSGALGWSSGTAVRLLVGICRWNMREDCAVSETSTVPPVGTLKLKMPESGAVSTASTVIFCCSEADHSSTTSVSGSVSERLHERASTATYSGWPRPVA